jgi:hypothetical protein
MYGISLMALTERYAKGTQMTNALMMKSKVRKTLIQMMPRDSFKKRRVPLL